MASTPLLSPSETSTCLPYVQATPPQLAQALAYVTQALARHFPTLGLPAWAEALQQQQPDLWVAPGEVYLDDEDLTRLTQRLATSPELPQLSPPIYPEEACYLARCLVTYQRQALQALADIEVNPTAYGGRVCTLVFDLATGNGIAQQVYRVTHRPGSLDPVTASLIAPARIDAVRRARGEQAARLCDPDEHQLPVPSTSLATPQ
jgi:hypothetical protein